MSGRRSLIAIVLLAAALHAVGIGRSILPAQDGLKFLRVARAFQVSPWTDVVRGTDQHPLYPALVALAEPVVALPIGHGPESWRIAAQSVAALASLLILFPLHGLARELFGPRVADMAALGFVVLPLPMAVGHDTLSDSLALLAFVLTLRLGLTALRTGGLGSAVGCGLAAGFGFLARPEVVVAPLAVVATGLLKLAAGRGLTPARASSARLATLSVAFLAVVGSYALVKGEVSEKLALRQSAALGPGSPQSRKAAQWLPPGLDHPGWDFSPKEESAAEGTRTVGKAVGGVFLQWSDGLCGVFAFLACWGLARDGFIRRLIAGGGERADPENLGRWLVAVYLGVFAVALVRLQMRMGYLSGRHTLGLVVLSLPWAAAGTFVCARGIASGLRWPPGRARAAGLALLVVVIAAGVRLQLKPAHPTRWGHREAGRWLAAHSRPGDAVLDTRGWAAYVSGRSGYDYWHVRQAFTDARLAFVVVGDDELKAESRRAATLRAVLAYAGTPVAGFPEKKGGGGVGVHVFRFERPGSWEGLTP